ncbi:MULTISPECIES: FAD-dependent oxidoreductase [Bhargavaea]|uniref:FAD-dependent oxidoreductase n=1 Tax=Bhargavaea changchunensis TaxID=2134037 RepID=A0ABW2NN60_9BACL|nr:FAD-dependent oxidoreductase [Bhargavaea sp. CC-171006]
MNQSLWLDTGYPRDQFPEAQGSLRCDVCIIGGGMGGIAAAEQLAKAGKDVIVLEKDRIFGSTTSHSTGKVTAQHDIIYAKLIKQFGLEAARTYYQANERAVRRAREIARDDEARSLDSILYARTPSGTENLRKEWEAYKEIGIQGAFVNETELPFTVESALSMHDELQIHPLRFGQRLARMAADSGARIFEDSAVRKMDFKKRIVELENGTDVTFKELILCTHYPLVGLQNMNVLKLQVNRSYIVAAKAGTELKNQYLGVDADSLSIRTAGIDGQPYLMVSGANHLAGMKEETGENYGELAEHLREQFGVSDISHQWSAQDPQTPDDVPYIGRITKDLPHIYISTGFRKWGLSGSLAGSEVLRDLITGRPNEAIGLYSPDRTGFGAKLLQGIKVAGLTAGELAAGYTVRLESPTCTHLGCKTRWNEGDRTWDCPCHGSRFREDGSVLEGPAKKPLKL